MKHDKYVAALKRELASSRGKRNAVAAEEILRELARNGEQVETRRKPGRPKKDADASRGEG